MNNEKINTEEKITETVDKKGIQQDYKFLKEIETKNNVISLLYDEKKLYKKFGELMSYHLSSIDKEPPEIKILFALLHDCKIQINNKPLLLEPCRFENPALSEEILSILSQRLGIESEVIFSILDSAPEGVVSVIISIIK